MSSRRGALAGCLGCALLVVFGLAATVAVGPQRALVSHLIEGLVVAAAWTALAVLLMVRDRPTGVVLIIAATWSASAACGGWALLGMPAAVAAAWLSVTSWAVAVGLSYTIGVLAAARWKTPTALRWLGAAAALVMAFAFATLPTITIETGITVPNALALPFSPVAAMLGVAASVLLSLACISALALGATSPSRRRVALPVMVAAIIGVVGICAGAVANQWAPLVQSLTVPLLPVAIAFVTGAGEPRAIRAAIAELTAAADPSSALSATLSELRRDLGLAGLAVEVGDVVVVSVGQPGENRIPLLNLGILEGQLRTPSVDEYTANELARITPSLAAVLGSARLIAEVRRSRAEQAVAREEERRRVRRDLHDEIGPLLAAIVAQTDVASLALDRAPERSRRSLERARAASSDAVAGLRRVVRDLDPVAADVLGLVGALEELAAHLSGTASVSVRADALPPLTAAVEVALYRIAAEAAGNAVRHASASVVRIVITAAEGSVTLTIADDGAGFSPDRASAGVGLASMRTRAEDLEGTLSIRSGAAGTEIVADILIAGGSVAR